MSSALAFLCKIWSMVSSACVGCWKGLCSLTCIHLYWVVVSLIHFKTETDHPKSFPNTCSMQHCRAWPSLGYLTFVCHRIVNLRVIITSISHGTTAEAISEKGPRICPEFPPITIDTHGKSPFVPSPTKPPLRSHPYSKVMDLDIRIPLSV